MANTKYTFTVAAFDEAGNSSALSAPLDVTTMADVVVPPPPPPPPPPPAEGLLQNGDFELGTTGWSLRGSARAESEGAYSGTSQHIGSCGDGSSGSRLSAEHCLCAHSLCEALKLATTSQLE